MPAIDLETRLMASSFFMVLETSFAFARQQAFIYLCAINLTLMIMSHRFILSCILMLTVFLGLHATSPSERSTRTAFIVVSKMEQTLSVYDRNTHGDTGLVAQFPCCMGKNKGNKQRRGDKRTPESPAGKPFKITMIQDASTWKHNFHDGRGNILAYGHWFLRLETPGHRGIGIHGSTNNENTVPGRASEGCIRLLDKDIITLKERYAYVGMPVTIQAEDQAPFPWEQRARRKATK